MAGPAIGHPEVPTFRRHAVVGVHVTFQSAGRKTELGDDAFGFVTPGTGLCHRPAKDRRAGVFRRADGVFTVAIGADGRFLNPVRACLTMDAFAINRKHVRMATPAGFGNMGAVHATGAIGRPVQIVGPMTIRTHRGIYFPRLKRDPMHRVIIRFHGFPFGQVFVDRGVRFSMAGRAGIPDVLSIHRGGRVTGI